MSIITYNDVTLPHALHTQFLQKPMMDLSMTDWYCTQISLAAEAIITPDYLAILAPNLGRAHASAADLMNALRDRLLRPRRVLSVKVNGVELIPKIPISVIPGHVDAQNGPQPQQCVITQMTSETFLITYSIITYVWENRLSDGDTLLIGHNVLYNRWSETQEIDECLYTTIYREGKYIIRSDNADAFIADKVRNDMANLGIRPGYLRRSSRYTVSPDGLGIEYKIVDKEVFIRPPVPAYVAEGEYIETSTNWGFQRQGEVHVRLKGIKSSDAAFSQAALITAAMTICQAKIRSRGPALGGMTGVPFDDILKQASVQIDLFENIVDVRYVSLLLPSTDPTGQARFRTVWGIDVDNIISREGFPPEHTPNYPIRGIKLSDGTGVLLRAAKYWDPSIPGTRIGLDGSAGVGLEVGEAGRIVEP